MANRVYADTDAGRLTMSREMTVVVTDGNELLAPVLEWLGRA